MCAYLDTPRGLARTQKEIRHETYPENRSRALDRCIQLQIALRIFSVPGGVPEFGQIWLYDESLQFYRSKSTFSESACLAGKLLVDPVRVVSAP